jgi:hypothetical protein
VQPADQVGDVGDGDRVDGPVAEDRQHAVERDAV